MNEVLLSDVLTVKFIAIYLIVLTLLQFFNLFCSLFLYLKLSSRQESLRSRVDVLKNRYNDRLRVLNSNTQNLRRLIKDIDTK